MPTSDPASNNGRATLNIALIFTTPNFNVSNLNAPKLNALNPSLPNFVAIPDPRSLFTDSYQGIASAIPHPS
jgi:hypothetical protein